jgi:hypothetical protein
MTADPPGGETAPILPAAAQVPHPPLGQTLQTLNTAIARWPDQFAFVWAKSDLLLRHSQTNEALSLLSNFITETEAKGESATNLLARALEARSALLRRINRPEQSRADWLRLNPIPARDAKADPKLIDLTAYYNGSLTKGWIPSSQYGTMAERNLGELPLGLQELGGVRFDVRGLIQLAGDSLNVVLRGGFPAEVKGVKIGRPCRRLHFLQGTGWRVPDGMTIGRYVIHYADGQQQEVPLVYGVNVRDWWFDPKADEPTKDAVVAWTGSNPAARNRGQALRLYKFTWQNPRPDSAIESLDFVSENSNSSPFLIALTVE